MLTVRRGKLLHLPRRHCDQNTLNPAKHQRILRLDQHNRLCTTIVRIEVPTPRTTVRGKKKSAQKALFPNSKRRSVLLILERLEYAIAGVFAIVDRQPSLSIDIERPGVKAL